uniref:Terminase large subunit n=1 Tax=Klebsiella phage vB_KpnP_KP17 TaxID=3116927 RepID=A0AB38ZD60_9CAUD
MSNSQQAKNALIIAQLKGDFVAFLFVLWKALNLPEPTKCQIDMAKCLANPKNKKFILQAFRGIGKSFITCAFVVWTLWRDPQLKILIVSASKERADANSIFIKNIIDLLPFLSELKPRPGQRDSVISFDVGPAKPDHSPSVKSVGITGQLTGSRADIIIADDVEIPGNSATQGAREKLWTLVQEFAALLKPLPTSRVIYLGTPQTEMTLYKELEDNRGYSTIIWPAQYPRSKEEDLYYGDRLAPMLRSEYDEDKEGLSSQPTDPVRFDSMDLQEREVEYGKAGYTLQFMLNPNLSDAEKYPLRLRDAIVCGLQMDKAPMHYQWLPNRQNRNEELPNVGMKGDEIYSFHTASSNTGAYQGKILVIDPSGRGKDETGWCVLYTLNGYIYLMDAGGTRGYEEVP